MESLWRDLRLGLRLAAARPGFTAVAVLTLALGIGPTTAVFSVVQTLLLTPPPYDHPESIVTTTPPQPPQPGGAQMAMLSTDDVQDWRREARAVRQIALYRPDTLTLTGRGEPVRLTGAAVSPSLFALLGVTPDRGRAFTDAEEHPTSAPVVILSHAAWQRRFDGDGSILGRPIELEGVGCQVVGIMPASFDFPTRDTEYWVPLPLAPPQRDGNTRRVAIVPAVARLAPGATREQAEAEANAVIARNQQPAANRPRLPLRLIPLQERLSGPVRPALLVLSGAIALVLLIACANVACLLLSRSATRQRELAVRAAIGAGRGRLVRQLLTEGAVLSLFGGVLGVAFAWWVLAVLVRLAPPNLLAAGRPAIDMVVLAFAAGVSLLTAALFGIAPALEVVSGDFVRSFQETGREASGLRLFGRNRMRSLLTVAQVALALVLLVGAGLLVRSLVELLRQDPGYRSQGVLAAQLSLPRARYPQPQSRIAFYDQLLAGLRQMPVVQTVGLTNSMPMSRAQINIGFDLPGVPDDADGAPRRTGVRLVSPGFVRALGIRLRAGREFGNEDRQTSERVVLVNTAFVDRYLRGLDAVGRQVGIGEPRRIVGVVESIKPQGLDSMPQPEIFVPYTQLDTLLMMDGPAGSMTLVARTDGDPIGLAPAIRSQVARLDPRLPVYDLSTLDQRVSETTAQRRFFATALAIFAGLALVLAGVGLYGVLSSQVAQSIREIGIRMALGAGPAQIRRAVLRNSVALTVLGLGLGLAGAWGLSRFLASLLFAVTPVDPATYLGAAVALAAAGLLGAWAPVRRAVSVDPVVALRSG